MINEEEKYYLPLLLDEPIYVVKHEPLPLPLPEMPPEAVSIATLPIAPVPEVLPAVALPEQKLTEAPLVPVTPPKTAPVVISSPEIPKLLPPVFVNKHKVLILFNNETSAYLTPAEEALLSKILAAVHLKIDQVDLVNYNNVRHLENLDFLKSKRLNQLVSFGIRLTDLKLRIILEKYAVKRVENIDMLLADSLGALDHDAEKKKQLWKALRQMFGK